MCAKSTMSSAIVGSSWQSSRSDGTSLPMNASPIGATIVETLPTYSTNVEASINWRQCNTPIGMSDFSSMDGWGLSGTTCKVSFIILWCSLLICGTENITYVFWWIGTTEEIRVSSSSNKTSQLIMTFFKWPFHNLYAFVAVQYLMKTHLTLLESNLCCKVLGTCA